MIAILEVYKVKRKVLCFVLVLALVAVAMPIVTSSAAHAAPPAATSEATLAAVHKAYCDVLMNAIGHYGIGALPDPNTLDYNAVYNEWYEKSTSGEYAGQGMFYAELVYFGGGTIPQLLYVCDNGYGPGRYIIDVAVYGYSAGAELYLADIIGGDAGYFNYYCIVTDRNGVSYLYHKESYDSSVFEYEDDYEDSSYELEIFYGIRNGQWTEIPGAEIDIVSTRYFEYSPDTVRAVLAKLQSLLLPPPQEALPSAWSLNVNGGALRGTDMYNIGGNNYLKIRDIAALLDGTAKQFNITVDGRTVNMISGAAYEARGDEMIPNPGAVKTTTSETTFRFTLDGEPVELTAYLIAGSNYVRLRDALRLFDVFVDYNAGLREFYIDTAKAYVDN